MGEVIYMNEKAKPGERLYWPEMGDKQPEAFLRAGLSYDSKHYWVDSPFPLKGRGITFQKQYESKDLTASGQFMAGWYSYYVTKRAYEQLKERYSISIECLLD